jgi:hypothetical protein
LQVLLISVMLLDVLVHVASGYVLESHCMPTVPYTAVYSCALLLLLQVHLAPSDEQSTPFHACL